MDSFSMFPRSRPSRLNLGGRSTEYLLIGGLVVIIAGSLALTVFNPGKKGPGDIKPMWQCQACQHKFEPPPVTEAPIRRGPGFIDDDMRMVFLDCPKCSEKESCLPMNRCLECKEFYVSDITRERAEFQKANPEQTTMMPPRTRAKNVCPHCKTDQREWRRKNRKKKKSNRKRK